MKRALQCLGKRYNLGPPMPVCMLAPVNTTQAQVQRVPTRHGHALVRRSTAHGHQPRTGLKRWAASLPEASQAKE